MPARGGGIRKRRGGNNRGDITMGGTVSTRGGPGWRGGRGGKGPNNSAVVEKVFEAAMRGGHKGHNHPKNQRNQNNHNAKGGLEQISITGWKQSKAASNPGGCQKQLADFLVKKATSFNRSANKDVRIIKQRIEEDAFIIFVKPEHSASFLKLDNFQFAGAELQIKIIARDPSVENQEEDVSESAIDFKAMMVTMLTRRYNRENRILDLSALETDSEVFNSGILDTESRKAKFFPALMKIAESLFETAEDKRETVEGIILANNFLPNLSTVSALSQTFPDIKNLDLSSNHLTDLKSIEAWRGKFRRLEHLIISNNPLETMVPTYKEDMLRWFPALRFLNGEEVRTANEIRSKTKFALLILPSSFRDEASIAETFLKRFFTGYDNDRTALANAYTSSQSTFTLSVNTSALRASVNVNSQAPTTWEAYIKKSRNLKRLDHLAARVNRVSKGTKDIWEMWLSLPSTRHPDILAEPSKWSIDCHSVPGLLDPSGQSLSGVGGILIVVHGEFEEVDFTTGNAALKRSFDRIFTLGPNDRIDGVQLINDQLVIRAFGGDEAWQPEAGTSSQIINPSEPALPNTMAPEGWAVRLPGKDGEQYLKETMTLELSRKTSMLLPYCWQCLEETGWDLENAINAFDQKKSDLPSSVFAPVQS